MVAAKSVFAHYIVGLTLNQTIDQWNADIRAAAASSIDGFALNIGAQDHFNLKTLHDAYDIARRFDFQLFLSFDFGAKGAEWTVDSVANLTNEFKDEPAQFKVDGKPLVSTFEGVEFASKWKDVRAKVDGDIHFVPDWTSLTPDGVGKHIDEIDGHFSFDAWPGAGETRLSVDEDKKYMDVLKDKTYMMGVSPYFFTRLSSLNKNWYSSSDSLWFDRWLQVLELQPELVEIISWNDFGESHYIGDTASTQVLSDARPYVDGHDHAAFRFMVPYFAAAYKQGKPDVGIPAPMGDGGISAWYRTTPAKLKGCADGSTTWGPDGKESAAAGTVDAINILALVAEKQTLTVSMGGKSQTIELSAKELQFHQVMFGDLGANGTVKFDLGSKSVEGPAFSDSCPLNGLINFNAASVQVSLPRTAASQPGGPDGITGNPPNNAASGGKSMSALAIALALLVAVTF